MLQNIIRNLCNRFVIGQIHPHELPSIALSLLEQGFNSPRLTELAICETSYSSDISDIFEKLAYEVGIQIPSAETAAIELAREVAHSIINKEVDEFSGAINIWKNIIDFINPIPEILFAFKSNASCIEDYLFHGEASNTDYAHQIDQCKQEIWEASVKLLQATEPASKRVDN